MLTLCDWVKFVLLLLVHEVTSPAIQSVGSVATSVFTTHVVSMLVVNLPAYWQQDGNVPALTY